MDPSTPVLIGVGQITHRAAGLDDALSPVALMAEAVRRAAADAGLASVPQPDSIRVVALLSWRYRDPARFVAAALGLSPRERAMSTNGGNSPQSLVNYTALQIQRGELDLAILTGGEAWRTRRRARAEGKELWERVPEDVEPHTVIGSEVSMTDPAEVDAGVTMPVQVYPMFETALRAAAGETVEEHHDKVANLWARFAAVAANNPYAWVQSGPDAATIGTAGPTNRMIGFPYPKYMNSNNDVDQGAALIMCSAQRATSLGVPRDRWIFPHAGTDCHEHYVVSNRWSFSDTPAIRLGGRRVLELAGVGIDDIDIVDLYSCFPSAVQLGAASLGLGLDRQLTRTGGLSFAGGPWNNYVMHSIATVASELRERPGEKGLVWANGGFATKHAFGIYSTTPPTSPFRHEAPQDEIDALPRRPLVSGDAAQGAATIEAYTVMHNRDGNPETSFAAVRRPDGTRAWARSNDSDLTAEMTRGEWVHRAVHVDHAGVLHA